MASDFNISTIITNNFSKTVSVVGMKCILTGDGQYTYYGPSTKEDISPVNIQSGETKTISFTFKGDDEYACGQNFYNPSNLPVGEYNYNIYLYGKINDAPSTDSYHVKENLILENLSNNIKFEKNTTLNLNIVNAVYESSNNSSNQSNTFSIYEENNENKIKLRIINGSGEDAWFNGKLSVYIGADTSKATMDADDGYGEIDCAFYRPDGEYDGTVKKYKNGILDTTSHTNIYNQGSYIINHCKLTPRQCIEIDVTNEFSSYIGQYFRTRGSTTFEYSLASGKANAGNPAIKLASTHYSRNPNNEKMTDDDLNKIVDGSSINSYEEYYTWNDKVYTTSTGGSFCLVNPISDNGNPVQIQNNRTYNVVIYKINHYLEDTDRYRISHNELYNKYNNAVYQTNQGFNTYEFEGEIPGGNSNGSGNNSGSSSGNSSGSSSSDVKVITVSALPNESLNKISDKLESLGSTIGDSISSALENAITELTDTLNSNTEDSINASNTNFNNLIDKHQEVSDNLIEDLDKNNELLIDKLEDIHKSLKRIGNLLELCPEYVMRQTAIRLYSNSNFNLDKSDDQLADMAIERSAIFTKKLFNSLPFTPKTDEDFK